MYSLEKLKTKIQPGHVLHTFIFEHEFILDFLKKLELINQDVQENGISGKNDSKLAELKDVADHLVGAEPHHKREEDVLFPEVEDKGIFGPPSVMRQEHEELRLKKKELKNLVENIGEEGSFKKNLNSISNYIVPVLREHIDKENNILYPIAFEVVQDKAVWQDMKRRADKIGYCCFTPTE